MQLKNNYVAVEPFATAQKAFLQVADDNTCGTVRYVDESNPDLVGLVGKKVYFANTYVKLNIENVSYRVMKADNLVAVV